METTNAFEQEIELEAVYGEDYVDITDEVMCYEHGKTFECVCGQGIGVEFDIPVVQCATCKRMVVDKDYDERGPPEREKDQTGLSQWT